MRRTASSRLRFCQFELEAGGKQFPLTGKLKIGHGLVALACDFDSLCRAGSRCSNLADPADSRPQRPGWLIDTKHPRSLKGAKFFETSNIDLEKIDKPTTIFEGKAKEAVSLFPANINVAALLSLAGIGSEKTVVKIVADPNTSKNTHNIVAQGKYGKMTFTIENVPDETNPKTSKLAILSAIETLRKYCSDGISIGT